MRRTNCKLAAIMAAVLVLQTPMMANADYIKVYPDEANGGEIVDTNGGESSYSYTEYTEDDSKVVVIETKSGYELSPKENESDADKKVAVYVWGHGQDTTLIVKDDAIAGEDVEGGYGAVDYCAILEVQGDVKALSNESGGALFAQNGNITVDGDVYSENGEAIAVVNSEVYVKKDVESNKDIGVAAMNGSTVTVDGNVKSTDGRTAVCSTNYYTDTDGSDKEGEASYVEVGGNVTSANGYGVEVSGNGSSATIKGSVSAENNVGVIVSEGGSATVNGDVSSLNSNGVQAQYASTVTIGGKVYTVNAAGVNAESGSNVTVGIVESEKDTGVRAYGEGTTVTVYGSVTSGGENDGDAAVRAEDGATVTVGEAKATGTGNGVAVNNSNVTVNGNVSSVSNSAVNIEGKESSTVIVTGKVTGGDNDEYGGGTSVITNNASNVIIYGDVSTAVKNEDNSGSAIQIDLYDVKANGTVVALGSLSSYGEAPSLWINTEYLGDKTVAEMLELLPDIAVRSLNNGVGVYEGSLNTEDTEKEIEGTETNIWDYVADLVQERISYIINIGNGVTLVSGADSITAADESTYSVAKANSNITFYVASDYSLDESSLSNFNLKKNADGSYTVTVPKEGNINIATLLKEIYNNVSESSSDDSSDDDSSDDTSSVSATISTQGLTLSGAVGSSAIVVNSPSDWSKLSSYVDNAIAESTDATTPAVVTAVLDNVDSVSSEVISAIAGKNVILSVVIDSKTLVNIDGNNLTAADVSDVGLVTGTAEDGSKTINVRSQNLDLGKSIVIFEYMGLDKIGSESVLNFVNPDGSLVEFRTSPVYPNGFVAFDTPLANANYKMTLK